MFTQTKYIKEIYIKNDLPYRSCVLLILRVFSPNRFMAIFLVSVDPVCSSIQTHKSPWVFMFLNSYLGHIICRFQEQSLNCFPLKDPYIFELSFNSVSTLIFRAWYFTEYLILIKSVRTQSCVSAR